MNEQERIEQDQLTEPPIKFYGKNCEHNYFSNFSPDGLYLPHPFAQLNEKLIYYKTGEHRFQAMKARNESDHDYVNLGSRPVDAKDRGRSIELRDGWDSPHNQPLSFYVMCEVVWAKAMEHEHIMKALLETGTRAIWEDSPVDDVWGIRYRGDYRGRNLLGKAWMQLRDRLYLEFEDIPEALTT